MANSKRANGEEAKKRGSLDELWKLVDGIETAMLTTRRADGHLVSRPMATQKRSSGAHFWFVTTKDSPKVREIAAEPRVNLSYYKDRTREWVSVSGEARLSEDREKIRELWAPDWKAWFGDEGGDRDGGPDDPRMILIGVDAVTAQYMTVNKPQPLVLFEVVKGMVTGKAPDVGEVKEVPIRNRRTGRLRARPRTRNGRT
jgi:general stress protein 26